MAKRNYVISVRMLEYMG